MPDERQQFRILYRDFLFRIVDLELLARAEKRNACWRSWRPLLAAFSFTFTIYFVPRYGLSTLPLGETEPARLGDQDLLMATTMAIAGMFTVLAWNNVLPDRRDRLILGLLPVRPRTVLLAKLAALGTALGVAVAALNAVHGARISFRDRAAGRRHDGGAVWIRRVLGRDAGRGIRGVLRSAGAAGAGGPSSELSAVPEDLQRPADGGLLRLAGRVFLKPPYQPGHLVADFWFLGLFQK